MTDPNNGAQIREIAGISCRRLSPCSWVKLANMILAERRPKVQQNAEQTGADAETARRMLNEFDSRPPTRGDIIDFALIPQGIEQVYLLAFQQVKPEATLADVNAIDRTQDEVNDDVMWLLGLRKAKAAETKPGESPLTAGGSDAGDAPASTIETGTPKQTASA